MNNSLYKFSVLILAIAAVVLCAIQFFDPYLWFDESGQFFMGWGTNHYSDPFTGRGSLYDVIVNNRNFNLDPGGFSVLVWFWTLISTSVWFLRLLPLLFFVASVYFLYRILGHAGISGFFSLVFISAYVIFASVFSLIAEFRAYSMEICGTLMTLWLYLKYSEDFSVGRLLILSLVMAFFCTSRYSFILVAFVLAVFVLVNLFTKEKFGRFLVKSVVFGLPLLAVVLLVYFGMTRLQTSGALDYVGYIGKDISLLWSPLSLFFYLNALLCLIRYRKDRKVPVILVYSLCVSLFFFLLSVLMLFPWDLKRAVSVTLLNLLSLMVHVWWFAEGLDRKKWVVWAMDCFLVVCTAGLCYKLNHRGIDDIAREFEALDLSRYERVFISYDTMPDVKYQYEFGRLSGQVDKDDYLNRFIFEIKQEKLPDGSFDNQQLNPQDVDCDLYFGIDAVPGSPFVLEENCRFSYKKEAAE